MEKEINNWLANNKDIKIIGVAQSFAPKMITPITETQFEETRQYIILSIFYE